MPVTDGQDDKVVKAERLSIKLVLAMLLFVVALGFFYLITTEIVLEQEKTFDERVFSLLNFKSMPQLRSIMLFFTFFGSSNFLLPAYVLLSGFYLFKKRERGVSLNIAAIGISSAILLKVLKNIFKRSRPEEQLLKNIAGYSYPSGHSFSSFTFCGLIMFIIWFLPISKTAKWLWSILLFLFAAMVALSRVYFQVHYPSDVLAGFLLSIVWLMICYWILIKWRLSEKLFSGFIKASKN